MHFVNVFFLGKSSETGSFGASDEFESRRAPEVHVAASVHLLSERLPTNIQVPPGACGLPTQTGGSDGGQTWPGVSGGDKRGSPGPRQG